MPQFPYPKVKTNDNISQQFNNALSNSQRQGFYSTAAVQSSHHTILEAEI